jgi:uncharacterized protein (DUF1684 family)
MDIPLEVYVQSWLAIESIDDSNVPSDLALAVAARRTTLLTLVKGLGSVLTSEDDKQRGRGALIVHTSLAASLTSSRQAFACSQQCSASCPRMASTGLKVRGEPLSLQ